LKLYSIVTQTLSVFVLCGRYPYLKGTVMDLFVVVVGGG